MATIRRLVLGLLVSGIILAHAPSHAAVVSGQQRPLPRPLAKDHSHLSEWSRQAKADFLADMRANQAQDWIIVLGNEGGDTDSMVSALAWAYHISHLEPPQKACAVLQTVEDALDLRPENKLALLDAAMSNGHGDLLTIDELPIKPFELSARVRGIALVDHNVPLRRWSSAPIVSIIDHHDDRGLNRSASPRIISPSASCTSHVAKLVLDAEDRGDHHKGKHPALPTELVGLMLRAIALDSDGLKRRSSFDVDFETARRLHQRSRFKGEKLWRVMDRLDDEMTRAKKDLDQLGVRDLLRRDWKGDTIPTASPSYPLLTLGFASIPYSLIDQVSVTPEGTVPEWFAVERSYTSEVGGDVSICLNSFRDPATGAKVREIALVVAHGWGRRLDEEAAQDLFEAIVEALERSDELDLEPWTRPDGKPLLARRMVWTQSNRHAGRKVVRPIVERAAREWSYRLP